ncbi:hypothetical protein Tco_1224170 [Tanacetum coccineum]
MLLFVASLLHETYTRGETTISSHVGPTEIDLTEFQGDVQQENHEDSDICGNGEVAPSGGDANMTKEHL